VASYNPAFARAVCNAFGLDPNRVMKLEMTLESPGLLMVKATLVPEANALDGVIQEYEFVPREKDVLNG
jgi:hypothetical protein